MRSFSPNTSRALVEWVARPLKEVTKVGRALTNISIVAKGPGTMFRVLRYALGE